MISTVLSIILVVFGFVCTVIAFVLFFNGLYDALNDSKSPIYKLKDLIGNNPLKWSVVFGLLTMVCWFIIRNM